MAAPWSRAIPGQVGQLEAVCHTHELSKRLRKHTRAELCVGVSQDDVCVAPDFGSMNEVMTDRH